MVQVVTYERMTLMEEALEDHTLFLRSQAHLFSLLHGVALMGLREMYNLDYFVDDAQAPAISETGNAERMPVLGGLLRAEADILNMESTNRVALIVCWINRDLLSRFRRGGVPVPAPVLGRVLATVSAGFQAYMGASKIQDTPFPFPYAQMLRLMLVLFSVSTPIVIAAFTDSIIMACSLGFISTAGVVCLEEVSKELENPFGFDDNDLPLSRYHDRFNKHVRGLLKESRMLRMPGAFCDIPVSQASINANPSWWLTSTVDADRMRPDKLLRPGVPPKKTDDNPALAEHFDRSVIGHSVQVDILPMQDGPKGNTFLGSDLLQMARDDPRLVKKLGLPRMLSQV